MVDFGTATTCDAVSADGEYLGGAIAPGVEISLDALVGRAAALRQVEMAEPRSVLGRTTVESIQSGIVYGFAAQVDGLCARIEDELGECNVVATGGLSPAHRPLRRVDPARRALAHPARPPPRLRHERRVIAGMTDPSRVPYRVEPTHHAAEIVEAYGRHRRRRGDRRRGDRRRPAHAAAAPWPPGLRRPAGPHRRRPAVLPGEGDRRLRRAHRPAPRHLGAGHRRGGQDPQGRAVGEGGRLGGPGPAGAALPRQVARPHRPRHPVPAALRRHLGHPRGPGHAAGPLPDRVPLPPLAGGPGLHRGRDPDLPPHPRRRRWPSPSPPTTTRSTRSSSCASPPSST